MRKRRCWVVGLGAVVVIGLILAMVRREREPEYGGKRLGQWVREMGLDLIAADPLSLSLARGPSPEAEKEGVDAIRHIGTNCLPFLLKWIRYERSPLKAKLYRTANECLVRIHAPWRLTDRAQLRAGGSVWAFRQLRSDAKGAVGDLSRLMNDPHAHIGACRATYALQAIGKPAFPVLVAGLTNQHGTARATIVVCASQMGEDVRPLVPVLIQCLKDTDGDIAATAASVLGLPQFETARVVPALTDSLEDSRSRVRQSAAASLLNQARARFPSNTLPAMPGLLKLLNYPEKGVREVATNAIRQIDPRALEKAGGQ